MSGKEKTGFVLDARLEADTSAIRSLGLCRALLMNDARFPWVILVPECAEASEIHELEEADRMRLMEEIARTGAALGRLFAPDKVNVGALGNIVRQLHVHVVCRSAGDAAWPGPVWGHGEAEPYEAKALEEMVRRISTALG